MVRNIYSLPHDQAPTSTKSYKAVSQNNSLSIRYIAACSETYSPPIFLYNPIEIKNKMSIKKRQMDTQWWILVFNVLLTLF